MDKYKQLMFECKCGVQSDAFSGMAQSETGELVVMWYCTGNEGIEGCGKQCYAIVAGMKPVLEFSKPEFEQGFTEEDHKFLKENHCHLQED